MTESTTKLLHHGSSDQSASAVREGLSRREACSGPKMLEICAAARILQSSVRQRAQALTAMGYKATAAVHALRRTMDLCTSSIWTATVVLAISCLSGASDQAGRSARSFINSRASVASRKVKRTRTTPRTSRDQNLNGP